MASGLARLQVIEMVNWYLRASTPTTEQAIQVVETPVLDPDTGELVLELGTQHVQGEGTLPSAGNYIVSGHSLGGHLTTVFSRLFNDRVISSHTFNGLGVGQSFPESFIAELETELGLGPTTWAAVDGKQKNYYAQHGISIATSDWWLQQRGERIALFIEQGGSIANHLMYKLTDALALYDVLGALDAGLSLPDATTILNAASVSAPASLETVLDALRRLYRTPDQTPTRIGDVEGNDPRRAHFHEKLAELRSVIGASPVTTVSSLAGMSASELLTRAQASDGLAYRYALKELNAFAVLGPDTLYALHNRNGQLNLFTDAGSSPAGMTERYLADRAQMLAFLMQGNTNDTNVFGSDQVADQVLYRDLALRPVAGSSDGKPTEVNVFLTGGTPNPRGSNTRVIGFGTDGAEALQGRDNADRLYGGLGTDLLTGGKGDDYFEGGAGLDLYPYGGARSVLGQLTNDGDDEILDTDGKGVIRYAFAEGGLFSDSMRTSVIGGIGVQVADTEWRSLDGKFTYTASSEGLLVTINGDAGGSVFIRDFDVAQASDTGHLGIRLVESSVSPVVPQSSREIFGDRELLVSTASVPAIFVEFTTPDGTIGHD
ncbi:MAG TPA: calcium-binding protein, partial [Vicinamibacterales bacterium]|nr:calcium-binding protein [Vicinamibacterales bacterium]